MKTARPTGSKGSTRRGWLRPVHIGLVAGAAVGVLLAAACGDDEGNWTLPPPGTGSGGFGGNVAACTDGDTDECWAEVGQNGSVLTCIHGQRTCVDGAWGACEGEEMFSRSAPSQPMAFSDAGSCGNPCDPACQLFQEDPDGAMAPTPQTVVLHGADIWMVIPGGHIAMYLKQPCTENCDCQADHWCNGGICFPYWPGDTDPACPAQEDYTVAIPCGGRIPICNRGAVAGPDPPQPIIAYIQPGNCLGAQDPFCICSGFGCNNPLVECTITETIQPGECAFITEADCIDVSKGTPIAAFPGGENSLVVNSMDFPGALPECSCSNNWAAIKDPYGACPTVDFYDPVVRKETYVASCGQGEYVQWGYLAYEATTPSDASGNSRVLVEAHTAETEAELADPCSDCVEVADIDSSHPDSCPFAGPDPCPVNLFAELGQPAANYEVLELIFSLWPTPNRQTAPDVITWDVTYSCVPSE